MHKGVPVSESTTPTTSANLAKLRPRYTSRGWAVARFLAQQCLLKAVLHAEVDVHVHGRENLKHLSQQFIVVANHSSHLDAPLVLTSLPGRLSRWIATGAAADYFFRNRLKALPTALFFNAFPIERQVGGRNRGMARQLLGDGVPLLVFPEGTRGHSSEMATFKPGSAALAISRNVPIVPVALVGAQAAMPNGAGWVRKGRPSVHVVYTSPVMPRPGETAIQFSERVRQIIARTHDETAIAHGLEARTGVTGPNE